MPERLVFPLRHGLQLTITGEPPLRSLMNFLKAALIHFRSQRDIQRVAAYTAGSFQGRIAAADCAISYPGDAEGQNLPPAAWADAVTAIYTRVAALETLRARIADGSQPAGEPTNPVIGELLAQPSATSHLAALAMAMLDGENESASSLERAGAGDESGPTLIH